MVWVARHSDPHHRGRGDDPLYEQLPRHPALSLAPARPKHLQGVEPRGVSQSDRRALRGPRLRGRVYDRLLVPLATTLNGTMLRADLDRPLASGGQTELELAYRFEVPEHGSDRMGREQLAGGWLYEVAQWYPRVAVYDDVRGWNTEQYLGQGEFYLEYGDFDVAITVPRSFVVASTGTLTNAVEVLTVNQRARLARAARPDTTVAIIPKTEVGQPFSRAAGPRPTLTWHFTAKNVRDVAWAAAANFIWDASGYDGILIQSFYPLTAKTVRAYSVERAQSSFASGG